MGRVRQPTGKSELGLRSRWSYRARLLLLLRTVLRACLVFWWVLLRRLWKGPKHPCWSFRKEFVATMLRRGMVAIETLAPEDVRATLPSAPIPVSHRRLVRHDRGSLAGMYAEYLTPRGYEPGGTTILYLHGGGYVAGSPGSHRDLISRLAVAAEARCVALGYRVAPEFPFPAAIEDGEQAYRTLLSQGVPPQRLFLAGDSAGGGLALAVLLRARELGLPMARAAVLLSPWVDLSRQGKSILDNARFDYLTARNLETAAGQYLQGVDPSHPLASPLCADLTGLPPLLIQTGASELFLSENLALAERARACGVEVIHDVADGMVHVFPLFASMVPECEPAIRRMGAFVRELSARGGAAAQTYLWGQSA